MSFFDYFSRDKVNTASLAKERLQIIVAHERKKRNQPDYLPQLQKEIMEVINKYVEIDLENIEVQIENDGNYSVLELNITLPG